LFFGDHFVCLGACRPILLYHARPEKAGSTGRKQGRGSAMGYCRDWRCGNFGLIFAGCERERRCQVSGVLTVWLQAVGIALSHLGLLEARRPKTAEDFSGMRVSRQVDVTATARE
jgi:hypothetical protein